MFFTVSFGSLVIVLSGCNTMRGAWLDGKGAVRGMQAAYNSVTVSEPGDGGGATSQRMRELGWNDDRLLDSPGYGEPMRPRK